MRRRKVRCEHESQKYKTTKTRPDQTNVAASLLIYTEQCTVDTHDHMSYAS